MTMLPYIEYSETGELWFDGKIPSTWELKRIRFLVRNKVIQVQNKTEDEIYIELENIEKHNGKLISISDKFNVDSTVKRFSAGDILFGRLRPYLAKAWLANQSGVCVGELLVFEPVEKIINAKFLLYRILTSEFISYVNSATDGAKMPRGWRFLADIKVPVSSLNKQQAIVQFLDYKTTLIDQYISNKQRQIELLEKLRTSIISEAVSQGLNSDVAMKETEVEWLGKIPRHWQLKKIKYLGRFQGGGTPSKENAGFWNGTIPWVSPKDMGSAFITDSEDKITEEAIRKSATNLIKSGAIVLVMRSGILRRAIPVAILSIDATLNQDMKAIIPREEIIPEYLLYLIHGNQSKLLVEWVKEGSTVESIEYKLFADTKFPVPPIEEEQQAIINFIKIELGRVDTLVNQLNQQISKMEAYRASLISEAVTGKIDVRDFKLPNTELTYD